VTENTPLIENIVADRLRLLRSGLDEAAQIETGPELGVVSIPADNSSMAAVFRFRVGGLGVKPALGGRVDSLEKFMGDVGHERQHGGQIYGIARAVLKQSDQSAFDLTDSMSRGEFGDMLADRIGAGSPLSDDYVSRIVHTLQRDKRPVTEAQESYADNLSYSWATALPAKTWEQYSRAGRQADETQLLSKQLNETNGTDHVAAQLRSPEVRAKILEEGETPTYFEQWLSGTRRATSQSEEHGALQAALDLHRQGRNGFRIAVFDRYMGPHEVDAFFAQMRVEYATRRYLRTSGG
jgi:hypothetical protein